MYESPADMEGTAMTPADRYLFMSYAECKKLLEDKAQLFHHLLMKLLYL